MSSVVCPKCAHTRQAHDAGPDCECPKCGIVYAKFSPAADLKSRIYRGHACGNHRCRGRSAATQNTLRDARQAVMGQLRAEAYALGADAIVGVTLDYSEFSGAGKSMLFVVATGTAVVIKRF